MYSASVVTYCQIFGIKTSKHENQFSRLTRFYFHKEKKYFFGYFFYLFFNYLFFFFNAFIGHSTYLLMLLNIITIHVKTSVNEAYRLTFSSTLCRNK